MVHELNAENSKYISFDGTMKLNTQYELVTENPVTLDSGFTYAEVNISEFKKISTVKVTEFNAAFPEVMIDTPNKVNFNNYSYTNGTVIINDNLDMAMPKGCAGANGFSSCNYLFPIQQNFFILRMKLNSKSIGEGNIETYFPMIQGVCDLNVIKDLVKNDFNKIVYFYTDKIHGVNYITAENRTMSCYYNEKYSANFDGNIVFSSGSKDPVRFAFDELSYAYSATNSYPLKTEYLFWKDGNAITIDGAELDWNALTDNEKQAAFKGGNLNNVSYAEKLFIHVYNATEIKCMVDAVPKDQLLLPRGLIQIENFDGIDKATLSKVITGDGACKTIITTDLKTYHTYNFDTQAWKVVDHTDLTAVKSSGIDTAQLARITRNAWDKLLKGKAGIGVAYLLSIESTADKCEIDKLAVQVDMKGVWVK